MTFTRLRNIVASLKEKYATELAVYRATPLALDLCDRMAEAVTPGKPKSTFTCEQLALGLFRQLRDRRIRVKSWVELARYLSSCLRKLLLPQVNDVLRSLFPKARERGLIPPARREIPFRHRRTWKAGMAYFMAARADDHRARQARGTLRQPLPDTRLVPVALRYRPAPAIPANSLVL